MAKDYGAKLIVASAYPAPVNEAEAVDRTRPGGDPGSELMALLKAERWADGPIAYRIGEGDAADVILDLAEREGCDLIVMGTHGRNGLRRAVIGSVAEAVVRRASCPVLTIRPDASVDVTLPGDKTKGVTIAAGSHTIQGLWTRPEGARGVVLFAHGSGSSRFSPRNRSVAKVLNKAGFATLLMDLLDESEAEDRRNVFDAELLADRLLAAADWLETQPEVAELPIGLFGASTGSAAALVAAARHPDRFAAVVSRGGRPDLAWDNLPNVSLPTLLIVGSADTAVMNANRDALEQIHCPKQLVEIPGACHLFSEPGALEEVGRQAVAWFAEYLPERRPALSALEAER
jgi:nucleotide-binding universal stress UspA family protein/dienelactone hydrolase